MGEVRELTRAQAWLISRSGDNGDPPMSSGGSVLSEGCKAQFYLVASASIHLRQLALMDSHVTMTIHSWEEYYRIIPLS